MCVIKEKTKNVNLKSCVTDRFWNFRELYAYKLRKFVIAKIRVHQRIMKRTSLRKEEKKSDNVSNWSYVHSVTLNYVISESCLHLCNEILQKSIHFFLNIEIEDFCALLAQNKISKDKIPKISCKEILKLVSKRCRLSSSGRMIAILKVEQFLTFYKFCMQNIC